MTDTTDNSLTEHVARAWERDVEYTTTDPDAVCRECRGRGGHLPGCSQNGEPWPTVTFRRKPTREESAQAAISAVLERLGEPTEEMIAEGSSMYAIHFQSDNLGVWDGASAAEAIFGVMLAAAGGDK